MRLSRPGWNRIHAEARAFTNPLHCLLGSTLTKRFRYGSRSAPRPLCLRSISRQALELQLGDLLVTSGDGERRVERQGTGLILMMWAPQSPRSELPRHLTT